MFNGREPDEDRWDFDFGPLDSVSARLWFRPSAAVGCFRCPRAISSTRKQLEPGNIERTTASASWLCMTDTTISAITAGYGGNDAGPRRSSGACSSRAPGTPGEHALSRLEVVQPESR